MPNRYTPEFKKHHVEAWRASRQTRRQYCESQGINEGSFKHWPSQINAKPKHHTAVEQPEILPIQIARPSASHVSLDTVIRKPT